MPDTNLPRGTEVIERRAAQAPALRRRAASPLRSWLRGSLVRLGLHPHIASLCVPFKIAEFNALMSHARLRGDERVLDLGCGPGLHSLILSKRCREVVGVDICEDSIAEAQRRAALSFPHLPARFMHGRIQELDLEPMSFDKVFSFCVIEHIPEYREVLARVHELLRPGGELLLTADSLETIDDPELLERHRHEHHVHQYFRRDTLTSALTEAGFEVTRVDTLFRGAHARQKFSEGLTRPRQHGLLGALWASGRLRLADRLAGPDTPGLFLLATAYRSTP